MVTLATGLDLDIHIGINIATAFGIIALFWGCVTVIQSIDFNIARFKLIEIKIYNIYIDKRKIKKSKRLFIDSQKMIHKSTEVPLYSMKSIIDLIQYLIYVKNARLEKLNYKTPTSEVLELELYDRNEDEILGRR